MASAQNSSVRFTSEQLINSYHQNSSQGVLGSGFRVLGSVFWVQGSGFSVLGLVLWVQGSGFRVLGSGFWV